MIYFLIDLRMLRNYGEEIREQFSSIKKINLDWLTYIIFGFIIGWLLTVIEMLVYNYFSSYSNILIFINFFAFFLFYNFIFYKGLSQPEIFLTIEEKQKYVYSKLTETDSLKYLAKLNESMEQKRLYLNPNLTLKELASELSIPVRHLSQVINEHFKLNFYDYINRNRIEEAKKKLSDPLCKKTVLEILYEVGFSSKSSFNTAFKRFAGITPTRFKEKVSTD